jgi:AbrB family looped-hinge helix DNA binding protein
MEDLIKVREKGQITLPLYMRKKLHLEQGDLVLAKIVDNTVVLVPQETVDKDQAWFWTERWQKLEGEAEADIQKGRIKSFDSVEDLFDEIENTSEAHKNGEVQKKRS